MKRSGGNQMGLIDGLKSNTRYIRLTVGRCAV